MSYQVLSAMEDIQSFAMLMNSTSSKIEQLQKAFAELESRRAVTLNLKWKELEEHFHGLQRSLKRRFVELEDQEKEFETKTMEAQDLLEEREAAIVAKEQVLLEKLQEKRDAAVFAISCALNQQHNVQSMHSAVATNEVPCGTPVVEEKITDIMACETNLNETRDFLQNANINVGECENVKVQSYPQLVKLCEEMNAEGLHKFISDNRKDLVAIRDEIPLALKAAADPAGLALDSLKDFYSTEGPSSDGKKDSKILGLRRTCIMLLECLSIMLENLDRDTLSGVISKDAKQRARVIADEWKPKLDVLDMDASSGNLLEAHAFLQLLSTYDIASDFDKEEILKLIPAVSRRRQTADLCRALGLTGKMPGVIEVLINSGRQIDGVNMAFAFNLTEQFSPVPLLKAYLKEMKKTSSPVKAGNTSAAQFFQNEVNERELMAHKAVIKCIEDHGLEDKFPLDPLQKRVIQLEKAKADKKRVTEAAKPQPKRPRASGGGFGPRVPNIAADKTFYSRATDRYPQYMYDRQYGYSGLTENHGPLIGSAAYNLSHGHANYFGSSYQYQAPYLHA